MKKHIADLKRENRFSYMESNQITLNHLNNYTDGRDLLFKEITLAFLKEFESYLRHDLSLRIINSARIYLNNIRSVYYHAIDAEIIKGDITSFRKFKIQQEKTKPRPLDVEELRFMLGIRHKVTKQQQQAIDIFFLSFYLCGINLKDLIYLKHENVVKGRIEYKRFKTGRAYSVKIFPQAQAIINRHKGEKYLLSFMDTKEILSPERLNEASHDILSEENKLLKRALKDTGAKFKASTYSARYSWATIAAGLGISRDVIAHALGHGINTMTDIYIDFDLAKVDEANEVVINSLQV